MAAVIATVLAGLSVLPGCTGQATTAGSVSASGQVFNDVDVAFAQQMIIHHRQAVSAAEIAQTHAQDPRVARLATQIVAEQTPQIKTMNGWLQAWGRPTPTTMPHMPTRMPHMPTRMPHMSSRMPSPPMVTSQMPTIMPRPDTSLMGMHGAQFDRAFLEMMIRHHERVIATAEMELASGTNPAARQLARTIETSQSAQISQMRQILATSSPHHT
jgi:uncharacterized protein (DUF305 family)